ncbi:MAG: SGNH/GDSL hydrolase family protein [Nitrospiraceae bacterium]
MPDTAPPTDPTIVCFGDSLTAGFQSPCQDNPMGRETPYGDILQERLGRRVQVVISGVCGELTGEMVMRLSRDALRHRPRVVVILGGTNDLGWNADVGEVMRNLVTLYERTSAVGAVPVPVTVPSIRLADAEGADHREVVAYLATHIGRRDQLNRLIRDYAERKGLGLCDLFAATSDGESRQLAALYCNDGLHLSTAGYRRFADVLYDEVFSSRLDSWFPHTAHS